MEKINELDRKIMGFFKNKSLKTFLKYSLKYKTAMLGVILLSTVTSLMSAVPAWLSKYLIDDVLVKKNAKMMMIVIGAIFASTILKVITNYFADI
ncbi:MAG: hypothetical protein ACRCRT_03485, partial [Cetobacterium somerae]